MIIRKVKYKEYLYKWLVNKKSFVKESTYASYSNIVFNHIIPKLGNYNLDDINHDLIQNYILELYKNGKANEQNGLSIKTIKDIVMIIKSSIKMGRY